MIELRFHQDLYTHAAVDEAVTVYRDFGRVELLPREATGQHLCVRVEASADGDVNEHDLAAELANYALGRTAETVEAGPVLDDANRANHAPPRGEA